MIDATGEEGEDEGDEDGAREPGATSECPAHKNKGKLTDEQVVGQAVGILLAGYETTANTLAYTSYLLALNPDIQEKLQSEIDGYFDDKPVSQRTAIAVIKNNILYAHRMPPCMKQVKRSPTWTT